MVWAGCALAMGFVGDNNDYNGGTGKSDGP